MAAPSFQTRLISLILLLYSLSFVGALVIPAKELPQKLEKRVLNPPLPTLADAKAQFIKPKPNECVFWSGSTQMIAWDWAADHGKKLMGAFDALPNGVTGCVGFEGGVFDQKGERELCEEPTCDEDEEFQAIGIISQAYAELCSGEAVAVLEQGYNWARRSIWLRYELPALKANPDITKIMVQYVDGNGKTIGGLVDVPV